ncbi:MAG: helix-turn-helix domain-containing protein [Thainema sp.]
MTDLMTASLSQASILNAMTTDLWQQVQPRLQQSGIYQKIVAYFQQSDPHSDQHSHQRFDDNPVAIQSLLDQMAQTVINLVSEVTQPSADLTTQLNSQLNTDIPIHTAQDTESAADDMALLVGMADAQAETTDLHAVETAIAEYPKASPLNKLKNPFHWSAKPSPMELRTQRQQARAARLLEIADLLKHTREQKGISLAQIHQSTHVTIHQLQLLENGNLEQLPEDIYLRGFIRRIGNVLGLDGMALASSIPSLDDVEAHTVKPSWQVGMETPRGIQFQSAHLYVAYAALMAGSAGGLNLIINSSQPTTTELPPLEPLTESSQSNDDLSYLNPDSLKSLQEVAPPEVMPY